MDETRKRKLRKQTKKSYEDYTDFEFDAVEEPSAKKRPKVVRKKNNLVPQHRLISDFVEEMSKKSTASSSRSNSSSSSRSRATSSATANTAKREQIKPALTNSSTSNFDDNESIQSLDDIYPDFAPVAFPHLNASLQLQNNIIASASSSVQIPTNIDANDYQKLKSIGLSDIEISEARNVVGGEQNITAILKFLNAEKITKIREKIEIRGNKLNIKYLMRNANALLNQAPPSKQNANYGLAFFEAIEDKATKQKAILTDLLFDQNIINSLYKNKDRVDIIPLIIEHFDTMYGCVLYRMPRNVGFRDEIWQEFPFYNPIIVQGNSYYYRDTQTKESKLIDFSNSTEDSCLLKLKIPEDKSVTTFDKNILSYIAIKTGNLHLGINHRNIFKAAITQNFTQGIKDVINHAHSVLLESTITDFKTFLLNYNLSDIRKKLKTHPEDVSIEHKNSENKELVQEQVTSEIDDNINFTEATIKPL